MTATETQFAKPMTVEESHPLLNQLLRIYCRVLIVLMLYVLSTGPMYWLIYEAYNMGGSSFLSKLYFPIAVACENDAICRWFDWYVGLWVF